MPTLGVSDHHSTFGCAITSVSYLHHGVFQSNTAYFSGRPPATAIARLSIRLPSPHRDPTTANGTVPRDFRDHAFPPHFVAFPAIRGPAPPLGPQSGPPLLFSRLLGRFRARPSARISDYDSPDLGATVPRRAALPSRSNPAAAPATRLLARKLAVCLSRLLPASSAGPEPLRGSRAVPGSDGRAPPGCRGAHSPSLSASGHSSRLPPEHLSRELLREPE